MVYSNTPNETIEFKFYDDTKDLVSDALQTDVFVINANVGGVINPKVLSTQNLSSQAGFMSFGFQNATVVTSMIEGNNIKIQLPIGTDISSLSPVFSVSSGAKVYVGTKLQTSGIGTVDFTNSPVVYKIVSEDGSVLKTFNVAVTFEKEIIITVTPGLSKVYGQSDPEFTYTISGLQQSEVYQVQGKLEREAGEDVGVYAINLGTLKIIGYKLILTPAHFNINKASQSLLWNQELIFGCGDEKELKLTAQSNSGLPVVYSSSDVSIAAVENDILHLKHSGKAIVTASQPGNNNYFPAEAISKTATAMMFSLVSRYSATTLVFDNSSRDYVDWQWYKNGEKIANATKQYYTETRLSGTYHVVATNTKGLQETSCPIVIEGGKPFLKQIEIYPNPVKSFEEFVLKLSLDEKLITGGEIRISSLQGVLISKTTTIQAENKIKAPDLPGMYIVNVFLSDGSHRSINLMVN